MRIAPRLLLLQLKKALRLRPDIRWLGSDLQYCRMMSGVMLRFFTRTGIRLVFISGGWRNTDWMEIWEESRVCKTVSEVLKHNK